MKKSILFIINPISGGKSKLDFPKLTGNYLDKRLFDSKFIFTEGVGHAQQIAAENSDKEIIVAVGGDGTINEIASTLEGSGKWMGIIPCGSGNGLARAMGIPLKHADAVSRLNNLNTTLIDSGTLNNRKFFNMAGVGFDAHISKRFAEHTGRGVVGYFQTALSEISTYKPQNYVLQIDGKSYDRTAFMISIANSSQYGNNAHISPFASVRDGLLDVCIIRPFPLYLFPVMGYRMFSKTSHKSNFVEIIKGREIRILRER
ncbi:MAG TPA: YegS/Rv2252/BmrU family lipid kinase, partial [Daejeonella sp.]|nr:YegS/Rv2252/BmrU family lipid kinase [Daejeonella sp.]